MLDINHLATLVQAFLIAPTPLEMGKVCQEHPELLTEDTIPIFTAIIESARKRGETKAAQFFEQRYEMLQASRQQWEKFNTQSQAIDSFEAVFMQAVLAEEDYKNSDMGAIDRVVTSWEQVLKHPDFSKVDVRFCLEVIDNSANIYLRRYREKGDASDLKDAVKAWKSAIDKTPANSPNLPIRFNYLGHALLNLYKHSSNLTDLQAGIQACQQAVDNINPSSPKFSSCINELGLGLSERYKYLGNLADLQAAIDAYQQAVDSTPSDSQDFPKYLYNLGAGLADRYEHLGNLADLQAAIDAYQQAIDNTAPDSLDFPRRLNNLGKGFIDRYTRLGNLADLQAAIDAFQQAITTSLPDYMDLPSYFNNLGIGYTNRYERLNNLEDLYAGIQAYQQAISKVPPNSSSLPSYLSNLSSGLNRRYECFYKLDDLHKAIDASQRAVNTTPSNSPKLPGHLNNLGAGLTERYRRLGKLTDLQAAIDAYQQAIAGSSPNSLSNSTLLGNLGIALTSRYKHLGNLADLKEAQKLHQEEIKYGEKQSLQEGIRTARNWLNWTFEQCSWKEVEITYLSLKDISIQLVGKQLSREYQESFLQDTQKLPTKAAYAFAKLDKPKEAAEALEQGQARLLSESLALTRTDLSALQNTEYAHLYDAYEEITQRWHWAQQHKPEQLKEIREQLDGIIEHIRQLPGYAEFLKPSAWADIELAAADAPLLYVLATEHGGLGLLVQRADEAFTSTSSVNDSVEVQSIWIPDFTEAALQDMLQSYLQAYNAWLSAEEENHDAAFTAWCDELDKTTRRLWDCVFAPLQDTLPEELVLIPAGLLNLLPLHAAWTTDDKGGRRYALDNWRIRYAPNARSLHTARALREQTTCNHVLAIENPTGDIAYAAYLTPALQRFFSKCAPYNAGQASHDKVLKALPEYDVINFYCHGKTIPDDPLQSLLALADKHLTLDTLLKSAKLKARLVTLCACETGIPGTKLPDEVVSLAAGLLQAGVAGVVSSLWSVADFTTMLLMNRFYQLWREDYPDNPAEALRRAQHWIRDSSLAEFRAYFQAQMQQDPIAAELYEYFAHDPCYAFADPQQRPFAHPFYWAAFGYVGV